MTFDKRKRAQMLAHCQNIHPEDGIDPKEFFRKPTRRDKPDRKTEQLCHQVADTLGLVLASEFDDPLLHSLLVVSVTPAPNASQLLVTVRCDTDVAHTPEQILARLQQVAGHLRSTVAEAITRKRAPRLLFQVIGGAEEVSP